MSTFNVHEWNQKRRLEEMESSIPGWVRDKSGIIEAIYNVIDLGRETGLLSDDEIEVLEKLSYSVSDKLVKQESKGKNLDEGAADIIGNGIIKIMDWAFFGIMADNEEAFNLLMDTLKDASNEEKAEMLTNLSKFLPKPTLRRLAKAELANIAARQDQLRKAFR